MKSLNVLITGAGGAAAIAFYKAVRNTDHQFFMADMSENSVGLFLVKESNRCLIKGGNDKNFIDHLLKTCQLNQIDILVPTVDCELLAIALNKASFEKAGVKIISSEYSSLVNVLDKYTLMKTLESDFDLAWFEKYDEQLDINKLNYPCLIKPRCDSGSRGIKKIESENDLKSVPKDGSFMIQEYLANNEYSVDVYLNHKNKAIASVVRERIKTYGGVAVISKTIQWKMLSELASHIAEFLNLRYAVNVQFKLNGAGKPCLLEINPRFPGTSSLTVAAGVNMPDFCLHEAMGGTIELHQEYQELAMIRRWQETFIKPDQLHSFEQSQL